MSHLAREVPTGPVAVEDGAPQLDWPTFTVLIPSFNREHLIARALDSVDRQSYRHVEILLIDDGSTDHTAWRLSCWTLKARTRIRYLRQPNSGTHCAYNEGVRAARGDLVVVLGSDDELAPDALMRLAVHWMAIAPQMRAQYCGVAGHGLLRDSQRILGDAFPAPVYDASYLELTCRLRISGDKPGAWRRDLLLAHPFPVVPGERFMLDNFVLRQLGLRYRTRYIQEVISLFEYQPDGLTARRREVRMQAPQGMANYFLHDANAFTRGYGLRARYRAHVHYVRFAFHARRGMRRQFRDVDCPCLWLMALIAGTAGWLLDLLKQHRRRAPVLAPAAATQDQAPAG